jgi:hypothetical protein
VIARQGHTYRLGPYVVMAMDSGPFPEVHIVDQSHPWPLLPIGRVEASRLQPLPMVYFNGETPW